MWLKIAKKFFRGTPRGLFRGPWPSLHGCEAIRSRARTIRETISVSIPHHLGKEEALRRIKTGVTEARTTFASVLTIQQEDWTGDTLAFRLSALAQQVAGTIQVADSHVKLDVELPWLLAKLSKVILPAVKKEGTLLLEKK